MKRAGASLSRARVRMLVIAVVLFAGNLGFYIWYRATTQERRDRMEARRVELMREVETREAEASKLAAQRERLSSVSAAIDEFYARRVGPRREALAPVVQEIHSLLDKSGVVPASIGYSTQPVTDLPLSQMVVTFSFHNDYMRFKQLVHAVETNRRWIVVRDIGVSRDQEVPGGVQVQMKLATYFAADTEPETVPKGGVAAIPDAAVSSPQAAAPPPVLQSGAGTSAPQPARKVR